MNQKKKQNAEPIQPEAKITRQTLMFKVKERGIKNFRILNKEELRQVLADDATADKIQKVVDDAVNRWKSGWGSRKVKNES